ncbi:MAG: hypothetical protein KIT16_21595 [Rhodospirillaceae bacterium]|nr:hypothetical protein [Rhodospirillaceae bacterium]
MTDGVDLVCGCCEILLAVFDCIGDRRDKSEARSRPSGDEAARRRRNRERKRGVRIRFAKRRVVDVEFLDGPHAGKSASALSDMELKRLALSLPNRTARFALRRYLGHRKAGRTPPPKQIVKR